MKRVLSCALLGGIVYFSSCKTKDNPTPVSPIVEFDALEKVLDDSVPVRFGGKCYAVIYANGQEVFSKSYGGYAPNSKEPVGSCSKWMSAAVLMTLVDDGVLKITDSIGKYLPIFTTYHKGKVTIGQLFSHTSGFPGESSQGYEKDHALTLQQAVDSIAKNVDLINPPGTKFYYGGVSMQIGGRIAEVVSGKSWTNLFHEKIEVPCGMADTDYSNSTNPYIAGGASSTPDDYAEFLMTILSGGVNSKGKRVLQQESVQAMIDSQLGSATIAYSPYPYTLLTGDGLYGLGTWRDAPVENSSPGDFGSHPWVNYEKQVVGFLFTRVDNDGFTATLPTAFEVRRLTRDILK